MQAMLRLQQELLTVQQEKLLSAGTTDAGFISGGTYVTYDDDCDVLLTAQRKAINKDSLNAKDWNDGTEEAFTDNLTTYYRSIILAGPSTKGQELAAKVNAGQKLTWDDLNSATWAVMGASSASGYIYQVCGFTIIMVSR